MKNIKFESKVRGTYSGEDCVLHTRISLANGQDCDVSDLQAEKMLQDHSKEFKLTNKGISDVLINKEAMALNKVAEKESLKSDAAIMLQSKVDTLMADNAKLTQLIGKLNEKLKEANDALSSAQGINKIQRNTIEQKLNEIDELNKQLGIEPKSRSYAGAFVNEADPHMMSRGELKAELNERGKVVGKDYYDNNRTEKLIALVEAARKEN